MNTILIGFYILLISFTTYANEPLFADYVSANNTDPQALSEQLKKNHREHFARLLDYQKELHSVHPLFGQFYPVAIVKENYFFLFEVDESGSEYEFSLYSKSEMPLPEALRAAFPLEFHDDKPAVVITEDAFDTKSEYALIFHEFVHCFQFDTAEPELRANLPLAQKALEEEDYMWELAYPFPYDDPEFAGYYTRFLGKLENQEINMERLFELRRNIKRITEDFDYQYMVWQEWKEGFALFIENQVREKLNLPENRVGRQAPYDRTVFYAGGAAFIRFLVNDQPELLTDLKMLFEAISAQ